MKIRIFYSYKQQFLYYTDTTVTIWKDSREEAYVFHDIEYARHIAKLIKDANPECDPNTIELVISQAEPYKLDLKEYIDTMEEYSQTIESMRRDGNLPDALKALQEDYYEAYKEQINPSKTEI